MQKVYTVAIIGVGSRGANAYGTYFLEMASKFKIVSLCDLSQEKLAKYAADFNVDKTQCFTSEKEFFKEKRADVLCVATPDKCHIRHAIAGLKLGYDLLLEKPISDNKDELEELLNVQKEYGGKVCVCHVLRYAPAFIKVAELLDSGVVGKLVTIESLEQVWYFHQAHSYVRGNWHRREDSTPMIMAKCCHDLDLLQFYAKSPCVTVSSVGDLSYFKRENMPEGATPRCLDCPYKDTCAYSATYYIKNWHQCGMPADAWPWNVLTQTVPLTEDSIMEAIKDGPYGKCVFDCDNDVVDHQITQLQFENGVTASLTMTAFTHGGGREMRFHCTNGEVILSESHNCIELRVFGKEIQTINLVTLTDGGHAHGGGDGRMIECLFDILEGRGTEKTSLTNSVESHLMAIAAEESRLEGGKLVTVHRRSLVDGM